MAASETGSGNNILTASDGRRDSNGYLHIIDHALLKYVTANIARHCPTAEIQEGGHPGGSGNNF